MHNRVITILFLFIALLIGATAAQAESLDNDLRQFKKDLLQINKRLFIMEEELLFPANTQVIMLVSLNIGEFFTPDGITVKLDGKLIQSHLYTQKEVDALKKGAIQRLLTANVKTGKHELTALISGLGPDGQEYRRGATLEFEKAVGQKYIQLKIIDDVGLQQPEFVFKEWE